MSLDLDSQGKKGLARTDVATPETTDLSALADADFIVGVVEESTKFVVYVEPSAGNIVLAPSTALTGLVEGDEMVIVKLGNANKLSFTDPETGIVFDYANKNGESYTLIYDGAQWIFKF